MPDWKDRKVQLGTVAAIAAGLYSLAQVAPNYIVLQAHAAEDRKAIARLLLADVRESILDLELQKVRVKNRSGLSEPEKQEQIALLDRKIKILEKREECLAQGKVKCP